MKSISKEEVEFIVLQLIDQGKFEEADLLLAQNKMTSDQWSELKTTRYSSRNLAALD